MTCSDSQNQVYLVLKQVDQCSAFVFNAWVVVDLPIMDACTVHDGLRLTWLDTTKTDVLAIVQADQRLLVSAKQLI